MEPPKHKGIIYNKDLDFLDVQVDVQEGSDIVMTDPIEGFLKFKMNAKTGAVYEIMLSDIKENLKREHESFNYDKEEDCLEVSFSKQYNPEFALCDMIYMGDGLMITLGRNKVGNLIGMDIVGLEEIMKKFDK